MESLLRIIALIRKELLAVLKDPRSRASLFLPPVLQCLVFGYAATYDLNSVPYAVLDQDHSAASHELLAALDGSGIFERVANLTRAADITTMIDDGRVLLVVQIGQDFERDLAGRPHRARRSDRRWPQLQYRRHGIGLCQQHRRRLQCATGPPITAEVLDRSPPRCAPGTTPISRRAGS